MNNVTYSFILTTIAGFASLLGTIPMFLKFKNQNKIIAGSLSLASGVMLTVSIIDLIPESISLFQKIDNNLFILYTFLAVLIGMLFSCLLNILLPTNLASNMKEGSLFRLGLFSLIAIVLHNIPEGIATFLTTNQDKTIGLTLTLAITLHNIPEGISIAIPIYYATKKRSLAFLFTLVSALSEPFGALLAFFFFKILVNNAFMAILMGMIAGIMSYIAIFELISEAKKYEKKVGKYFIIGALIMLITHFLT